MKKSLFKNLAQIVGVLLIAFALFFAFSSKTKEEVKADDYCPFRINGIGYGYFDYAWAEAERLAGEGTAATIEIFTDVVWGEQYFANSSMFYVPRNATFTVDFHGHQIDFDQKGTSVFFVINSNATLKFISSTGNDTAHENIGASETTVYGALITGSDFYQDGIIIAESDSTFISDGIHYVGNGVTDFEREQNSDGRGIVAAKDNTNVTFKNCRIEDNYSNYRGAIYFTYEYVDPQTTNLTFDNVKIYFNYIDRYTRENHYLYGMIYLCAENANVTFNNCILEDNCANFSKGNLLCNMGNCTINFKNTNVINELYDDCYIYNDTGIMTMHMENTVFDNCGNTNFGFIESVGTLNVYGDAVYEYNGETSEPLSKMSGTIVKNIYNNYTEAPFAFIHTSGANSHIEGINFYNNVTSESTQYTKGIVYFSQEATNASIANCNFVNNNCLSCICVETPSFKINDCILVGNTVTNGAVYLSTTSEATDTSNYEISGVMIVKDNTKNFYCNSSIVRTFAGMLDKGSDFYFEAPYVVAGCNVPFSKNEGKFDTTVYHTGIDGLIFNWLPVEMGGTRKLTISAPVFSSSTFTYTGDASSIGKSSFGYHSYDVYRGIYKFASSSQNIDVAGTYYYSDGYFEIDSSVYYSSLATMSLAVAMTGCGSNEQEPQYQYLYWYNLMQEIGYKNLYINKAMKEEPTPEDYGVMIANKKITIGSDEYIVININVRNSGSEIANVMKAGTQTEHNAISSKASLIIDEVNNYMNNNGLDYYKTNGKIKFWVTGYSYGGSIANIVAKKLVDLYQDNMDEVYGYAIGNMAAGHTASLVAGKNYNGIHSVLSSDDLIASIFNETNFNYIRYGVIHYLPSTNNEVSIYTNSLTDVFFNLYALDSSSSYTSSISINKMNVGPTVTSLDTLLSEVTIGNGGSISQADFVTGLVSSLSNWSSFNKAGASTTHKLSVTTYPSLEDALYNFLVLFEKLPVSNRLQVINNICSFYTTLSTEYKTKYNYDFLSNWDTKTLGYRLGILKVLWNYASDNTNDGRGINSFFTDEETESLKESFYTIALAVLDFYCMDTKYQIDAIFEELICSEKGVMLGTFVANMNQFIGTHTSEVYMAWLRSLDSNFNEKNAYNDDAITLDCSSYNPTTPSLYSGSTELGVTSSAKSFNAFNVRGVDGEMLIYSIQASNSVESITMNDMLYTDEFQLYSLYGDNSTSYTVTVYSYAMGRKSASKTYTVTINALELTGVTSMDKVTTYDGESYAIDVSKTGISEDALILYANSQDGTYQETLSYHESGVYTIYYKAYKQGYKLVIQSQTLTINKAKLNDLQPIQSSYVYTGSEQYYLPENDLYTLENNSAINAGTVVVTAKLVDGENYAWSDGTSEDKQFSFVIQKANYDMSGCGWNYSGSIQYDGQEHNVEMDLSTLPQGIEFIKFEGKTRATSAGTYKANIVLSYDTNNYNDPTLDELTWEIKAYEVQLIWPENNFSYNGARQNVVATYVDEDGFTQELNVIFDREFKETGSYIGQVNFYRESYHLSDEDKMAVYEIKKASMSEANVTMEQLYYNGTSQQVTIYQVTVNGCEATYTIKDGTNFATDRTVDGYKLVLVGTGNFEGEIEVAYNINPYPIFIDWSADDYSYSGEVQTVTASFIDFANQTYELNVTMDKEFKNAGTYLATVSFKEDAMNYTLPSEYTKEYTIQKKAFMKPVSSAEEYVYTGKVQTFIPLGYDSKWMTIFGNKQQEINTDGYQVTVKLLDTINSCWEDKTTEDVTLMFVMNKQKLAYPKEDQTDFYFNGYVQTYLPVGFDSKTMNIEGNIQTAMNKKGYTVTVSIKDKAHYTWVDGSTDDVTFKFIISDEKEMIITKDELENGFDIETRLIASKGTSEVVFDTALGEIKFNKSAVIDLMDTAKRMKVVMNQDGYNTVVTISILSDDGEIKEVNGTIVIALDYRKVELENAELKLYAIGENNAKTEVKVTYTENTATFNVKKAGGYAFTYVSTDKDPDDIEADPEEPTKEDPVNPVKPINPEEPAKEGCAGCNSGIDAIYALFILPVLAIPFGFRLKKNKKEEFLEDNER